jgi:hypothetical protein
LYNSETVLLTVESIKLDDENNQLENIKFLKGFSYLFYQQLFDSGLFYFFAKDSSNLFRYFIYHESGVHSVHMPWLEDLQISYLNKSKYFFYHF